jgi:hypothetical protein
VGVSVVRGPAWRRWSVVAAGVAVLCALPAVVGALPVPGSALTAAGLRARIMASAAVPYQGYAESVVDLGLPELPDLGDVTTLLDGSTDQYAWYRSPDRWRADVLAAAGENDVYQTGQGTYLWDYGRNLLTQVTGAQPVRLPRAADLLPPALARRLLGLASPADRLSRLPSRRIAGLDAAGLRLVPAGQATTIGQIDVWADPASGLPLQVEIIGRGAGRPALVARFLQVSLRRPALATVTPSPAPGAGVTRTRLPDVSGILSGFGLPLPASLAGQRLIALPAGLLELPDLGLYGSGLARFVVLPLPFDLGSQALADASDVAAGAGVVSLTDGTGVLIRTPLLSVLLARTQAGGPVYLLAGAVTPALLARAGSALLAYLAGLS